MKHEIKIPEGVPFVFGKKLKTILVVAAAVGLLALLIGIFVEGASAKRIWANLWLNGIMFLFIGLGALFFWAVNNLGESAWQLSVQRVLESMGQAIPFAAILLLAVFPGYKGLFEWMNHEHLDHVLEQKVAYLNIPFWLIRFAIYFIAWTLFSNRLRKLSLNTSLSAVSYVKKIRSTSGWFIVVFAVTSSMLAWDWLMSIDAHWFSTLYGWYTFSSMFVMAMSVIILIVIGMKKANVMPHVSEEHLHDLGKYLFGFSIFWAYLWISQFLLIWYSNIPEETFYFVERVDNFGTLFFANVIINFAFPFLALMTRGSKRQLLYLAAVAIVVFVGHFLDVYLAIMPGAVGHEETTLGVLEIGLPLLYLAIFLWIFFTSFKKAKVLPEQHPYLKEAFDYENI